jgi:F-type H+-transporting ATPase subunit b
MMTTILPVVLVFTVLVSQSVNAAGGGDAHQIPSVIYYQALNFGILLIALHLWQRKAILKFFSQRHQTFLEARTRALHQKKEAEAKHADIRNRLNTLSGSVDETVDQARKEAEKLKESLVAEANEIASRLRQEAQKTAQFELEKAVHSLRESMIDEALERSRQQLENLGENDRLALQKEFVQKIQVVPS